MPQYNQRPGRAVTVQPAGRVAPFGGQAMMRASVQAGEQMMRMGGEIAKWGVGKLEEIAVAQGEAAGAQAMARTPDGRLTLPDMESEWTAYGQAHNAAARQRYLAEASIDAYESRAQLMQEHALEPEEFDKAWQRYSRRALKGLDGQIAAGMSMKLTDLGMRARVDIQKARFEHDAKSAWASTAKAFEQERVDILNLARDHGMGANTMLRARMTALQENLTAAAESSGVAGMPMQGGQTGREAIAAMVEDLEKEVFMESVAHAAVGKFRAGGHDAVERWLTENKGKDMLTPAEWGKVADYARGVVADVDRQNAEAEAAAAEATARDYALMMMDLDLAARTQQLGISDVRRLAIEGRVKPGDARQLQNIILGADLRAADARADRTEARAQIAQGQPVTNQKGLDGLAQDSNLSWTGRAAEEITAQRDETMTLVRSAQALPSDLKSWLENTPRNFNDVGQVREAAALFSEIAVEAPGAVSQLGDATVAFLTQANDIATAGDESHLRKRYADLWQRATKPQRDRDDDLQMLLGTEDVDGWLRGGLEGLMAPTIFHEALSQVPGLGEEYTVTQSMVVDAKRQAEAMAHRFENPEALMKAIRINIAARYKPSVYNGNRPMRFAPEQHWTDGLGGVDYIADQVVEVGMALFDQDKAVLPERLVPLAEKDWWLENRNPEPGEDGWRLVPAPNAVYRDKPSYLIEFVKDGVRDLVMAPKGLGFQPFYFRPDPARSSTVADERDYALRKRALEEELGVPVPMSVLKAVDFLDPRQWPSTVRRQEEERQAEALAATDPRLAGRPNAPLTLYGSAGGPMPPAPE